MSKPEARELILARAARAYIVHLKVPGAEAAICGWKPTPSGRAPIRWYLVSSTTHRCPKCMRSMHPGDTIKTEAPR